jgi:hypothetical protein
MWAQAAHQENDEQSVVELFDEENSTKIETNDLL